MKILSGDTTKYLYFVAVSSADKADPVTGVSSFSVMRSRNGAALAAMTTPTINEVSANSASGLYELLVDEDTTVDSGNHFEELALHIAANSYGVFPITRTVELIEKLHSNENQVSSLDTRVSSIGVEVSSNFAGIGAIPTDATSTFTAITSLDVRVSSAAAQVNSNSVSVSSLHTRVSSAGIEVGSNAIAISSLGTQISSLNTSIADAVWDEVITGAEHNVNNSAAKFVREGAEAVALVTGTAQAGAAGSITLASGAVTATNIFNGERVAILEGTGAGQSRIIVTSTITTDVCEVAHNWTINPDNTSVYAIQGAESDLRTIDGATAPVNNLADDYDGTGYSKSNSSIGTCFVNSDMRGTDNAATQISVDSLSTRVSSIGIEVGSNATGIAAIPTDAGSTWTAISSLDVRVTSAAIQVSSIDVEVGSNATAISSLGGTNPTAVQIADAVWDEAVADHLNAGSTGEALNAAGAGGDPWTTTLPGAYTGSQAGFLLGATIADSMQAEVSSINVEVGSNAISISSLHTRVSSISTGGTDASSLTAIVNQISSVDTRVSSIGVEVGSNATAIAAIPTDAGSTWTAISSIDARVNSAAVEVGSNAISISSLHTRVSSITGTEPSSLTAITNQISSLDVRVSSVGVEVGSNAVGIAAIPTDASSTWTAITSLDTRVSSIGAEVGSNSTSVGSLHTRVSSIGVDVSSIPAAVNSQMVDVLTVDAVAELSSPPAANASLADKIAWVTMLARNKITQTGSLQTLYADDGSTVVSSATVSDDGTTGERGKWQ